MFYPESGGIAGQPAVCAYDPVARDDDGYRVDVTRLCHRAACPRAPYGTGYLRVACRGSVGYLQQLCPYRLLEFCPLGCQRQVESGLPSREISVYLAQAFGGCPVCHLLSGQGRAGAPVQPCNLASTHCHRYWAGGSDVADCDVIIVIHACKVKILFPKFDVVVLFMKFKLINFAT